MDDSDLPESHRYWYLKDLRDPNREWTDAAKPTPAEREASKAVLEWIKLAPSHANSETEVTAIVQISQKASRGALVARKLSPTWRRDDDCLRLAMPAKRNGFIREEWTGEHVDDGDHMINAHWAKQSGKFVNGECRLIPTMASLLSVNMHMSERTKLVDVYATTNSPKTYSQWTNSVTTFASESAKAWHESA
jgi:hypothetical protein